MKYIISLSIVFLIFTSQLSGQSTTPDPQQPAPTSASNPPVSIPASSQAQPSNVTQVQVDSDILPEFTIVPTQITQEGNGFKNFDLTPFFVNDKKYVKKYRIITEGSKNLRVVVNSNKVVKAKPINKEWNGTESIVFKATDSKGNVGETTVDFIVESVNDAPTLRKIRGQKIREGGTFTAIDLAGIVKDADHKSSEMEWSSAVKYSGDKREGELLVTVDAHGKAFLEIPDTNWYGTAQVEFTVTDPEGAQSKAGAEFVVKSVNDKPIVSQIPSQKVQEGETFSEVVLQDYITDADHQFENLKISVKGTKKLKASITNGILNVTTPNEEFFGPAEQLTIQIEDPEKGKAIARIAFEVTSVNDAPEFKDLPSFTLDEGKKLPVVDLADYVKDLDHSVKQLKWSVTGNKAIRIKVRGSKLTFEAPNENWNGEEYIVLKAIDPEGAYAEASVAITVNSINDLPQIKAIKNQKIKEGQKFKTINLDDFISDEDHTKEQISWSYELSREGRTFQDLDLDIVVDAKRVATIIIPDTNFYGASKVVFTAEDYDGAKVSTTTTFMVESVNDIPVIKTIPDQRIDEGYEFLEVLLDDFIFDSDHEVDKMKWSVKGAKSLKVTVDQSTRTAYIKIPNEEFYCKPEKLTFTAVDPEGARVSTAATFEVRSINDEPELAEIPGEEIQEGSAFKKIDLKKYLTDIDNEFRDFKWSLTGFKKLKASIVGSNLIILVPSKNWNGEEYLTVRATDPAGAYRETQVGFIVESINDEPVIKKFRNQKIREGEQFPSVDLNTQATDEDHLSKDLFWTVEAKALTSSNGAEMIVSVSPERVATFTLPDTNWYGTTEVTYTVEDPEGASKKETVVYKVTSVNDKPSITSVSGQTIDEGGAFSPINLSDLAIDSDHRQTQLKWSVKGGRKLKMSIANNRALVTIPNKEWSGPTEKFTLTVTDPEKGRASIVLDYTVKEINDPPVLQAITSQTINEGESFAGFNLKNLMTDVDNRFNELKVAISGARELKVTNSGGKIKIVPPNKHWHGSEQIQFTISDPAGATASQNALFTITSVNDLPLFKKVKAQTIKEGQEFRRIDLSKFVSDSDHSFDELKWSLDFIPKKSSGEKSNPTVEIVSGKQLSIVNPDENWYGKRVLKLTVTDPDGGVATQIVDLEVTFVNDLPQMVAIAPEAVKEGESFKSYDLNALITDSDHSDSQITWSFSGNKELTVVVDKKNIARIQIPNKNWNGKESITFTAEDPAKGKAKQRVAFEVLSINDFPTIKKIVGQTIKEGASFKDVSLSEYVSDADHKVTQLKWSMTGNRKLKVRLAGKKLKVSSPSKNWNGAETLTLTVVDPEGAKATINVPYVVMSINDQPVVKNIRGQKIREGEAFKTITLDEYVSDADHNDSKISWKSQIISKSKKHGIKVVVDQRRVASIVLPHEDWYGDFSVKYTAVDPEKASATITTSYSVTSVNDKPVIARIPGQTIKEGAKFSLVEYNQFVSDADHSIKSLAWVIKGNKKLKVIHNTKKSRFLVQSPTSNWFGKEVLSISVRDKDGGSSTVKVPFEVVPVNDAPVFNKLSSQSIKEGGTFRKIDLNSLVDDVDHKDSELKWNITGNRELTLKSLGTKILVKAPNKDWFGKETLVFTVTDPEGSQVSRKATFSVASINDIPQLKKLKNEKIKEGEQFTRINLDNYVTDGDHKKDELQWSYTVTKIEKNKKKKKRKKKRKKDTSNDLQVSIDANRVATLKAPHEHWFGNFTVTFAVRDPEKARAVMSANYTIVSVNDLPVLTKIKDQAVQEGSSFKSIKLNDFVSDADHSKKSLKWSIKGNKKLKIVHNKKKNSLLVKAPNKNWFGSETIQIQVQDKDGGKAKTSVVFGATPVNDKPVISKISSQKVKEGQSFKKIDLNALVKDVDHKDHELKWNVTGNKELQLKSSGSKIHVVAPDKNWSGKETLTFSVSDPEGASVHKTATFSVIAVNDPPVISRLKGQRIKEGGQFEKIDLQKYVSDPDDGFYSLKFSTPRSKKQKNNELTLSINKQGLVNIEVPDEHWYGKESHTIVVQDKKKSKARITLNFEVKSVNDAPEVFGIQDQVINEGSIFKSIVLSNHVEDIDHEKSAIKWSITGNRKLKVSQKKGKVYITPPSKTWYGPLEEITFTARDPKGAKSSKKVVFTVNRINKPPVISKIKSQKINEGGTFKSVNLDKFVKDRDDKDNRLFWFLEGSNQLVAAIDYNRVLTVKIPHEDWNGKEVLTLTCQDSEGAKSSIKVAYVVKSVNDAPRALSDTYSTDEGKRLKVKKANGVLVNDTDPDGPKPRIAKLVKKPSNGKVKFKKDGSFTYRPKKGFSGDDTFQYKAKDRKGKWSKPVDVDITVFFKLQDIRK
ncbi:MAG: tandem-95 repeat protein [Fibrobacterales bacterium]